MNSMAVSVMESGDTKLARLLPEWMPLKETLVSCKLEPLKKWIFSIMYFTQKHILRRNPD